MRRLKMGVVDITERGVALKSDLEIYRAGGISLI
jgi:hypothetical protein